MNIKLITVLVLPLVIILSIQTVILVELNNRVDRLNMQINQNDSSPAMFPNLPTLTPPRQDGANEFSEQRILSY
ncbi:MAG: hypothetical protein IPN42_03280 [Methylococcaceae bacterium]|nr:hypothetical protein [Methylococcaceae bacterium]